MSEYTTDQEQLANLWMNGSPGGLSEWEQMEIGASRDDQTESCFQILLWIALVIFPTRQDCTLPI
jgi:hypothetical protein